MSDGLARVYKLSFDYRSRARRRDEASAVSSEAALAYAGGLLQCMRSERSENVHKEALNALNALASADQQLELSTGLVALGACDDVLATMRAAWCSPSLQLVRARLTVSAKLPHIDRASPASPPRAAMAPRLPRSPRRGETDARRRCAACPKLFEVPRATGPKPRRHHQQRNFPGAPPHPPHSPASGPRPLPLPARLPRPAVAPHPSAAAQAELTPHPAAPHQVLLRILGASHAAGGQSAQSALTAGRQDGGGGGGGALSARAVAANLMDSLCSTLLGAERAHAAGALPVLSRLLQAFTDSLHTAEPSLRALRGMLSRCDEARAAALGADLLETLAVVQQVRSPALREVAASPPLRRGAEPVCARRAAGASPQRGGADGGVRDPGYPVRRARHRTAGGGAKRHGARGARRRRRRRGPSPADTARRRPSPPLPQVMFSMRPHRASVSVQVAACAALRVLVVAAGADAHPRCKALGVTSLACQTLSEHRACATAADAAAGLLSVVRRPPSPPSPPSPPCPPCPPGPPHAPPPHTGGGDGC